MDLIHIDNNFNEEVKDYKGIVIVDFWANWCGPCRMFGPVFEEVSKEKSDIKFCKVDVDNNEDVSREFNIMSIPTVIAFKDGKEVKRNIGLLDKEAFIDFIEGV